MAAALDAGLGEVEARKTFASAWRAGEREPRQIPERDFDRTRARDHGHKTGEGGNAGDEHRDGPGEAGRLARYEDLYNARRFAKENAHRLMYCGPLGGWYVWDGSRWLRSENHAEQAVAGEFSAAIFAEAEARLAEAETLASNATARAKASPEDAKTTTAKARADMREAAAKADHARARRAQSRRGIESLLSLARSEPSLAVGHEEMDADHWVLNCSNGVLDLRAVALGDHSSGDRITKVTGCAFDPRASAPMWRDFLERVLPDSEVRGFVQRLAGYAMAGVIREHVLPIFHGVGANGKTVLVGAIQAVMGDYAGTLPPEVVAPIQHGDQHPTGRARLRGLRFAVASESDQTAQLAVATVKSLTGGDRIVARFMRQDFFEFEPTHKLVLATNHRPLVKDPGDAIWRRVLLVPFDVQIPEAEQDPELPEKLRQELPGILRWLVEGCQAWQADGLAIPDRIKGATAEYRATEDTLGDFVAERLDSDAQALTLAKELHREYREWAEGVSARPVAAKTFYRMLEERGIRRGPKRRNGATFVGIVIRGTASGPVNTDQHGNNANQHTAGDASDVVAEIPLIASIGEKQTSLTDADNRESRHNVTSVTPGDDLPGDSEQGGPISADVAGAKVRL